MQMDLFLFVVVHLVALGTVFLVSLMLVLLAVLMANYISATLTRRWWSKRRPVVPEVGPCTLTTLAECKSASDKAQTQVS